MIVTKDVTFNEKGDMDSQVRSLDRNLNKVFQCLQGRVRFGDATDGERGENISGEWQIVADTGAIDTEFSIIHTLGVAPVGFLVVKINKGGVIYDSGTAWTSTTIYLKASVANATVSLFLLK